MGFLSKIFGRQKLNVFDLDLGEIESFYVQGEEVGWRANGKFLDFEVEILLSGTKDGISSLQKQVLLDALKNETDIWSQSAAALKEHYDEAGIKFISIDAHFEFQGISVSDHGFEMTFYEKNQDYFFNLHFEDNKYVDLSIDS